MTTKRKPGRPRKNPAPVIEAEPQELTLEQPIQAASNFEQREGGTTTEIPESIPPSPAQTQTLPPQQGQNVVHYDEVTQILAAQAQAGDAPTDVDDFDDIIVEPGEIPGFPDVITLGGSQREIMPVVIGTDDIKASSHRYLNLHIQGKTPAQPVTRGDQRFNSIPRGRFDHTGICRMGGDYVYYIDKAVKQKIDHMRKSRGPVANMSRAMVGKRGGPGEGIHYEKSEGDGVAVKHDREFKVHKQVVTPVTSASGG